MRVVAGVTLSASLAACVPDASDYFTADIYFSEYVDGVDPSQEALEIHNIAATDFDLAACTVRFSSAVSYGASMVDLDDILRADEVYVICDAEFDGVSECDIEMAFMSLDKDTAVELLCGDTTFDIIGSRYGVGDSVNGVGVEGVTLRRVCDVTLGEVHADDSGVSREWVTLPVDDFSGLGRLDCP